MSEADWPLLEHLQRWLGGESLRQLPRSLRKIRRYACTRFQQLTSPAAAKAVEDTACYRSGILLSRNDVGFDPQHFSAPLQAFHDECLQRAEHFPRNMLTTATHDHKRGEDTRARIAVISERAEWFAGKVRRWREMSASHIQQLGDGAAPSPGDELMLFQILLGSWPLGLQAGDKAAMEQYCTRILQWQEKALREAKLRTTWSDPNSDYESACRQHVEYLLLADEGAPLRDEIAAAAAELAPAGALNSLVQSLLRMTTPGVPDLYQGTEYWDFSLVDPDNRRPVDFTARQHSLASAASFDELLQSWHDGRIKQAVIRRTLQLRRRYPRLFSEGRYLPLAVSGEQAEQLLAFARELEGEWVVVVVPRLAADLLGDRGVPSIPAQRWGNTRIELPEALNGSEFERLFDGTTVSSQQASLEVARVLDGLSAAVLHTSMTANGESQQ